jgi:predicted phosphodiesterase
MRRLSSIFVLLSLTVLVSGQEVTLPLKANSTRFLVLGDTGTGGRQQFDIGKKTEEYRQNVKFEFGILLGDNLYGSERPQDYVRKFEQPYKSVLDAGVKFYASLGNHDDPNQRFYKPFNMNGERYYTFTKGPVQFYAIDSNYLDRKQLDWLAKELKDSKADWKMAYFHHPLYSSGKHGSEVDLRQLLEPLFTQYAVDVVFAGHEHFYERIKPQKGIYYFTCGGAAKLRRGDINRRSGLTEKGFDADNSFMIVEVEDDQFHFQAVSRTGQTVDSGTLAQLRKLPEGMKKPAPTPPAPAAPGAPRSTTQQ